MKYYIAIRQEFLSETKISILSEDTGSSYEEEISFCEGEDAAEWIEDQNRKKYVLAHNESCRPAYKILNEDQAYGLRSTMECEDYSSLGIDWDQCADPENPTDDEIIALSREIICSHLDQVVGEYL